MSDLKKIATIEKNSETFIHFSITEYRGNQYVDVREHVESESYTGPTKKGLRFNAELLDQFITNLTAVKDVLEGRAEAPEEKEEEEG